MFCTNYVIKKGDTLYSISRQSNVPVSAIIGANPFVNVYNLQVGEVLCVPVGVPLNDYTGTITYTVKEGDTLGSVLDQYGIEIGDLMQLNDVNSVHLLPGTTLEVPIYDFEEDTDLS